MSKRLVLSILFLVSLGLGIGLASPKIGLDEELRAEPVLAQVEAQPEAEAVNEVASNEAIPEVQVITEDQVEPALTVVEMLEALNEKAGYSLKEGWLHTRVEKVFDPEVSNGVLPNGMAIPNKQITDLWQHLDANNVAYEVVSIMRTFDGQIVQVGVVNNGTGWNSATEEFQEGAPVEITDFDYNFLKTVSFVPEPGSPFSPGVSSVKSVSDTEVVFTLLDEYDPPITNSVQYEKPLIATQITAVFDAETGYLLSMETVVQFVDGSERVFRRLVQKITFEDPPDEVLNYLAEKAEREEETR